jgi:hypothetical protein
MAQMLDGCNELVVILDEVGEGVITLNPLMY